MHRSTMHRSTIHRRALVILPMLALLVAGCSAKPGATVPSPASATPVAGSQQPAAHAIGDRIQLGSTEYLTVDQVSSWNGNGLVKPQPNETLVAVHVTIEGIDPNGAAINPFWFSVEDTQRQQHDVVESGKDPSLQPTDSLAPGTDATGWVTFEIPQDRAVGLQMIYAPPFSDPVRVNLD